MKGKKFDKEFFSQYISDCISKNITSSDDMIHHAKQRIKNLDEKIKEIEFIKQERSKLLDVIYSFQKHDKVNNNKEIRLLSLYKINNPNLCKIICENLDKLEIKETQGYSKLEILICIKQLMENQVITKLGSRFVPGGLFNEYCSFVLKMDIL